MVDVRIETLTSLTQQRHVSVLQSAGFRWVTLPGPSAQDPPGTQAPRGGTLAAPLPTALVGMLPSSFAIMACHRRPPPLSQRRNSTVSTVSSHEQLRPLVRLAVSRGLANSRYAAPPAASLASAGFEPLPADLGSFGFAVGALLWIQRAATDTTQPSVAMAQVLSCEGTSTDTVENGSHASSTEHVAPIDTRASLVEVVHAPLPPAEHTEGLLLLEPEDDQPPPLEPVDMPPPLEPVDDPPPPLEPVDTPPPPLEPVEYPPPLLEPVEAPPATSLERSSEAEPPLELSKFKHADEQQLVLAVQYGEPENEPLFDELPPPLEPATLIALPSEIVHDVPPPLEPVTVPLPTLELPFHDTVAHGSATTQATPQNTSSADAKSSEGHPSTRSEGVEPASTTTAPPNLEALSASPPPTVGRSRWQSSRPTLTPVAQRTLATSQADTTTLQPSPDPAQLPNADAHRRARTRWTSAKDVLDALAYMDPGREEGSDASSSRTGGSDDAEPLTARPSITVNGHEEALDSSLNSPDTVIHAMAAQATSPSDAGLEGHVLSSPSSPNTVAGLLEVVEEQRRQLANRPDNARPLLPLPGHGHEPHWHDGATEATSVAFATSRSAAFSQFAGESALYTPVDDGLTEAAPSIAFESPAFGSGFTEVEYPALGTATETEEAAMPDAYPHSAEPDLVHASAATSHMAPSASGATPGDMPPVDTKAPMGNMQRPAGLEWGSMRLLSRQPDGSEFDPGAGDSEVNPTNSPKAVRQEAPSRAATPQDMLAPPPSRMLPTFQPTSARSTVSAGAGMGAGAPHEATPRSTPRMWANLDLVPVTGGVGATTVDSISKEAAIPAAMRSDQDLLGSPSPQPRHNPWEGAPRDPSRPFSEGSTQQPWRPSDIPSGTQHPSVNSAADTPGGVAELPQGLLTPSATDGTGPFFPTSFSQEQEKPVVVPRDDGSDTTSSDTHRTESSGQTESTESTNATTPRPVKKNGMWGILRTATTAFAKLTNSVKRRSRKRRSDSSTEGDTETESDSSDSDTSSNSGDTHTSDETNSGGRSTSPPQPGSRKESDDDLPPDIIAAFGGYIPPVARSSAHSSAQARKGSGNNATPASASLDWSPLLQHLRLGRAEVENLSLVFRALQVCMPLWCVATRHSFLTQRLHRLGQAHAAV